MGKPEFIRVARADIERVQKIAYDKKDEWEGDGEAVSAMDTLIEFTDMLLDGGSVSGFLSGQDML